MEWVQWLILFKPRSLKCSLNVIYREFFKKRKSGLFKTHKLQPVTGQAQLSLPWVATTTNSAGIFSSLKKQQQSLINLKTIVRLFKYIISENVVQKQNWAGSNGPALLCCKAHCRNQVPFQVYGFCFFPTHFSHIYLNRLSFSFPIAALALLIS